MSTAALKVDTPATTSSSTSSWPSMSKPAFKSTELVNVATPATTNSSN